MALDQADALAPALAQAVTRMEATGLPYAFVMRKGDVTDSPLNQAPRPLPPVPNPTAPPPHPHATKKPAPTGTGLMPCVTPRP